MLSGLLPECWDWNLALTVTVLRRNIYFYVYTDQQLIRLGGLVVTTPESKKGSPKVNIPSRAVVSKSGYRSPLRF